MEARGHNSSSQEFQERARGAVVMESPEYLTPTMRRVGWTPWGLLAGSFSCNAMMVAFSQVSRDPVYSVHLKSMLRSIAHQFSFSIAYLFLITAVMIIPGILGFLFAWMARRQVRGIEKNEARLVRLLGVAGMIWHGVIAIFLGVLLFFLLPV